MAQDNGPVKPAETKLSLTDIWNHPITQTFAIPLAKKELKLDGSSTETNKSKFGRTVSTLKGCWWVPAAIYISLMLAVLLIKFMAKMLGV